MYFLSRITDQLRLPMDPGNKPTPLPTSRPPQWLLNPAVPRGPLTPHPIRPLPNPRYHPKAGRITVHPLPFPRFPRYPPLAILPHHRVMQSQLAPLHSKLPQDKMGGISNFKVLRNKKAHTS